jgi:polysaccharide export outer membrane protein
MNFMRATIQFLSRPARAMALCGCLSVFLGLNAAAQTNEPAPAATQSNAVEAVSTNMAPTIAIPTASQPATNNLGAAPITNTAAAATNMTENAATNAAAILDDKHKLTIGDRLSFRIVEDEEDPKPLFVTDSGDLEVPYIGRVPAENKTCRQLAAEIKTELEKEYYYHATVIIAVDLMTKSHGRVYLEGAVRSQGALDLPGDEVLTLSKAILRAGGFTDYAKRDKVIVARSSADNEATGKDATKTKTFTVDVGKILDKQKIELDLPLESGDIIYVPDRLIRF